MILLTNEFSLLFRFYLFRNRSFVVNINSTVSFCSVHDFWKFHRNIHRERVENEFSLYKNKMLITERKFFQDRFHQLRELQKRFMFT